MHIDIFVCIPVVIFIITLIDNDPFTSEIKKLHKKTKHYVKA